ncbi:MAG: hypothetical protein N3G19_02865 [Candidatus Pacearchaeota archaeon]|nr:hypothetical protein [Candidatus Pacearchaeota archaeon]
MIVVNKKQEIRNKKAQEEVMGFVIIILIVMIIGLVFFAFSLRRGGPAIEPKQAELDDLIIAMLSYTTNCEINAENQSVRELIRYCNDNPTRTCQDNKKVCVALNSTLENMLQELIGQGIQIANAPIHGYELNISGTSQLTYIKKGTTEGNHFASTVRIFAQQSDIILKLKFYYSVEK